MSVNDNRYVCSITYKERDPVPMCRVNFHTRPAACKCPRHISDARALDNWRGELHSNDHKWEYINKVARHTAFLMTLRMPVSSFVTDLPNWALSSTSSSIPGGILKTSEWVVMKSWNNLAVLNNRLRSHTIIWCWVSVTYAVIFGDSIHANKRLYSPFFRSKLV